MESLLARLTERALNANNISLPSSPVSVVDEDKPLVIVESLTNADADEEELSNLMITILSGHQAIPIRVKIILDKMIEVLGYGKVELIFLNSQWTREQYIRGYKMEYPEFLSTSLYMVDEEETVDRLTSFILKSTLIQSVFPHGFAPPVRRTVNSMSILMPAMTEKASSEAAIPIKTVPGALEVEPVVNGLDLLAKLGMIKAEVKEDATGAVADHLAHILKHKRVSCDECGKTFCDRGALKTHRSAVHLREMHTCTVPGCGKQFNSTRSRDRHSSNPNQKLHTPDPMSFRDSLRNPTQAIATRLFPPASSLDYPLSNVKDEPQKSADHTNELKPNVSILKRKRSETETTNVKRPTTVGSTRNTNDDEIPHSPNMTMDFQMLLQQLIQNAPTHPSFFA